MLTLPGPARNFCCVHRAAYRILVVDPHADSGDSLVELLRAHGWRAQASRTGRQALSTAGTFHPRVVVAEVGLADLSAVELVRELRRQEGGRLAVVMLTSWTREEDLHAAVEGGFDGFFLKPADPQLLLSTLRSLARPRPRPAH